MHFLAYSPDQFESNFESTSSTHNMNPIFLAASMRQSYIIHYNTYVNAWLSDTLYHSSISEIVRHSAFEKLVGMGEYTLIFTLEKLIAGDVRIHWFPLLKKLAKFDPVPAADRGYIDRMTQHWVSWGKRSGKI